MAATLDDIKILLEAVNAQIPSILSAQRMVNGAQVYVVSGLSEISEQLGLIQAGEFRTGNGKEPGFGFTGGRFGWPGFVYEDETYFLAGVRNDIVQIGMRIEDGTLVFGTGTGTLDNAGIKIVAEGYTVSDNNGYKFVASDGITVVSGLYDYYDIVGAHNYLRLRNVIPTILSGEVFIDGRGQTYSRVHLTVNSVDNAGIEGELSVNQTDTETYVETLGMTSLELGVNISGVERKVYIHEDPGVAGVLMMDMVIGANGSKFAIGGDTVLWGGRNGVVNTFNGGGFNIDFNVQGQTDMNVLYLDASGEAIGFGIAPPLAAATAKVHVAGGIKTDSVRTRGSTMADNTAVSDTPAKANGIVLVGANDATAWGLVYYNTATPQTVALNVGSNTNVTTGTLTGTTGTVGKLTISCDTDGRIYIENRRGGGRNVYSIVI